MVDCVDRAGVCCVLYSWGMSALASHNLVDILRRQMMIYRRSGVSCGAAGAANAFNRLWRHHQHHHRHHQCHFDDDARRARAAHAGRILGCARI